MNGFDAKTEQGGAIGVYDLATRTCTRTIRFPRARATERAPLLAVNLKGKDFLLALFGERDPSSLAMMERGRCRQMSGVQPRTQGMDQN